MPRSFLFLLLCLSCSASLFAQEASPLPKLSPLTKIFLANMAKADSGIVPGYVYKTFNGRAYISAMIKVGAAFEEKSLGADGVLIGTKAGNIWTAQVPVENVSSFIRTPGISYIQLDEPVQMHLDSARKRTFVDSVQSTYGNNVPFYGNGVVVGVVDAGFDYTSPSLWDTGGTYYRVKKIWAQKTAGIPPAGYIYGSEMDNQAAMLAAQTDQPGQSHGAHVAGIAAGSGHLTPRYRGVAPLSDLVLVGIMPEQQQWISTGGTDVIDGTNYIYQYAASVGKPSVVNLSWGVSSGPHDGTSLYSQALDNLTGPGKIQVTSAANSGEKKLHLNKTFTTSDTLVHTFPGYDPAVKKTWVEMWGDTGKTFCVQARLYNGLNVIDSTGFVCMDDQLHQFALIGSNSDTCFVDIVATDSEFNLKPHGFMNVYSKVSDKLCLTLKSTGGTVHMWNGYVKAPTGYSEPFTNGGMPWATEGNTDQTITDNASTRGTITVGAYSTKLSWKTVGNSTYSYTAATALGDIAPFSSRGPAQDGRMKPDITGPGFGVVSAVNSFDPTYDPGGTGHASSVIANTTFPLTGRTYRYAIFAGTSMSSPMVSGIIALMLQVNKNLDPQQIRDILNQTAIHDNFTGAAMNNTWGGGKVNAFMAVRRALQATGIGGVAKNSLACTVFPNPAHNSFTIGFLGDRSESLQAEVYDAAGRTVHTARWLAATGYTVRSMNVGALPAGLYIVKVSNGSASSSLRLVLE